MNTYDIGDVIRLSGAFTDGADAPVDPDAVAFKLLDPAGAVAEPAPVFNDGVGLYHVDVALAVAGVHSYRVEGTGANAAAAERRFRVRRSLVLEAEVP